MRISLLSNQYKEYNVIFHENHLKLSADGAQTIDVIRENLKDEKKLRIKIKKRKKRL